MKAWKVKSVSENVQVYYSGLSCERSDFTFVLSISMLLVLKEVV